MIRHIVAWNLKEDFSGDERRQTARKIRELLEALPQWINGIASMKVYTGLLEASSRDLVLDSLFENEEALAAYQAHPKHVEAATFIRSVIKDRVCLDYDEEALV